VRNRSLALVLPVLCVSVCCSVSRSVSQREREVRVALVLRCVAVYGRVLQCVAV